ncbi:MAG: hypothetical protein R3A79_11225 [Nannocystaceae bacterium]
MSLPELLQTHTPIAADLAEFRFMGAEPMDDGGVWTTVRLIIWQGEGEDRAILDIKEQSLPWSPKELADPRLAAFIAGWAAALGEVFAAISAAGDASTLDPFLPSDLLSPDVLRLARPRSADDFCDALLQPRRLGELLPAQ